MTAKPEKARVYIVFFDQDPDQRETDVYLATTQPETAFQALVSLKEENREGGFWMLEINDDERENQP